MPDGCAEWGDEWGFEWGAAKAWGARENGDPTDETSPLVPIDPGCLDTIQTATDRTWKQYEGEQTWLDLLSLIGEVWGELDLTLGAVDVERYRSTAQGVQLDEVGASIGRARGSLVDDDDYRLAILVDAHTLFSSGTIPEILELANALTSATPELVELYPAAFRLRIPGIDGPMFRLLLDIMSDVPGAGIAALLSSYPTETVGGWGSVRGPVTRPASWGSVRGPIPADSLAHWSHADEIGA